jgi:hypothetical protein
MKIDARHIALMAVLVLMVALVGGVAGWSMRGAKIEPPTTDTIRIHTVDTLRLPAPPPDTVTNTVTRYVSVPVYVRDTDTIYEPVMVPLPFEQHFARLEDVADVWYSGYDAKIDSAVVYRHRTTEVVNHFADVSKMPRLAAGLGCGAIYQEKRVNAYLFGEIRYNAKKTTFGTFAAIDQNGRWCLGGNVCWRLTLVN